MFITTCIEQYCTRSSTEIFEEVVSRVGSKVGHNLTKFLAAGCEKKRKNFSACMLIFQLIHLHPPKECIVVANAKANN